MARADVYIPSSEEIARAMCEADCTQDIVNLHSLPVVEEKSSLAICWQQIVGVLGGLLPKRGVEHNGEVLSDDYIDF